MFPRVVLYEGPSLLDGSPIVALASLRSLNRKTGPRAVQTWILHRTLSPIEALRLRRDSAVCGDCPARGTWCYVTVGRAPLSTWRAYRRGRVFTPPLPGPGRRAALDPLFRGRFVRLGAYGDPAAVPPGVWEEVLSLAASHTGYTHQWRTCDPAFRAFLMASIHTPSDYPVARAMGWRTFRATLPGAPLFPGEFPCPASDEQQHRLDCERCRACDGVTASPRAASPVIFFHTSPLPGIRRHVADYFRRDHGPDPEAGPDGRIALPLTGGPPSPLPGGPPACGSGPPPMAGPPEADGPENGDPDDWGEGPWANA
jgi:hypothetical protein